MIARVLSPASTVVAGNASAMKNCDTISNSDGANGDILECLDARVYTHPAAVITANGGNAAFFDRKYSIIKM